MGVICIYLGIRDAKGLSATLEFCIPDTATLAEATNYAQTLADNVDDVIGGKIEKIGLRLPIALPVTLKGTPDENTDVEEGATFTWDVEGGYVSSNRLPTFLEDFITDGTSLVDQEATEVAAFINTALSGDGTVSGIVDYRGANIDSVKTARETFQKTRRARTL